MSQHASKRILEGTNGHSEPPGNPPATESEIAIAERARRDAEAALAESERRYRDLVERVPAVLYTADVGPGGQVTFISGQIEELLGYPAEDFYADPGLWENRIHFEDREAVIAHDLDQSTLTEEYRMLHRNGHVVWVRDEANIEHDADGEPYWRGLLTDVTEVRRAHQERLRLAAIVDSCADAVIGKSLDGTIVSWNAGAERLYGYTEAEAIGRSISMLVPEGRSDESARVLERIRKGERREHYESVRRRKDGSHVDVSLSVSPVFDVAGNVVGASTVARDMSERKRFESRLRFFAEYDVLTGIYNRRRFLQAVAHHVELVRRYGPGGAVLMLDLDNFKEINDALGHAAGDEILKLATGALHRRLRTSDIIGRLGGDEFAVLLPHANEAEATTVGRDLVRCLRDDPFFVAGRRVGLTASVGVALFDDDGAGMSAESLIDNADIALYEAKDSGRDRCVAYTPDHAREAHADARFSWPDRIRAALAEDKLELHLQPVMDLRTGGVSQWEALLRMRGTDGELIPPRAFLGPAARAGLIKALDRWVIREAVALVASRRKLDPDFRLEVNLSGESVADRDLPDVIERALVEHDVPPESVAFEVSEAQAIANVAEAARLARRLRELGCGFGLDDFGAGFGSFYYLKHLPVGYLKIDGDFIRHLADNSVDQVLVRGIVEVARGLDVETTAEFVGDRETMDLLRDYGVDCVQGFFVGRPEPIGTDSLS